jgi:hypothetical protein
MPSWKKVILSGSDATLNSLYVTTNVTASSFTGSFTGSFLGTASYASQALSSSYSLTATSASHALNADNTISSSYAATASVAFTGNNFVGTGITYLDNLDLGSSIASGASATSVTSSVVANNSFDEVIFSVGVTAYEALFIDYVIYDAAKNNKRAGNLRLTWNSTDIVFDETTTTSIGNTNNFTFSVDNSGTDAKLAATNTTGQDIYIIFEYKLLYIV